MESRTPKGFGSRSDSARRVGRDASPSQTVLSSEMGVKIAPPSWAGQAGNALGPQSGLDKCRLSCDARTQPGPARPSRDSFPFTESLPRPRVCFPENNGRSCVTGERRESNPLSTTHRPVPTRPQLGLRAGKAGQAELRSDNETAKQKNHSTPLRVQYHFQKLLSHTSVSWVPTGGAGPFVPGDPPPTHKQANTPSPPLGLSCKWGWARLRCVLFFFDYWFFGSLTSVSPPHARSEEWAQGPSSRTRGILPSPN